MLTYVLRRVASTLPVLLLVSLFAFLIVALIPGDAAHVIAGPSAGPAEIAVVRAELGLDRPWLVQVGIWYRNLLQGNLGRSFSLDRPVVQAILDRLPVTLALAAYAIAMTVIVGIAAGVLAAVRQNSWIDGAVMAVALLGLSLPNFWLALMLIFVFAVGLGWMPAGGYVPLGQDFWGGLHSLTLPALSLALMNIGIVARMTRSSMLEVLRQDYVRTARAKGVAEAKVILRHALGNALIPIITITGIVFSLMISGAVIIESVYALPGLGRLMISSIHARDFPVIQGTLVFVAMTLVLINLIVDLLYAVVDPRVRYQ
jgi:peptide/nickel transport system permease protein